MNSPSGWRGLFAVGAVLVILGAVLPFLMVLYLLPSTFLLNFLAYGSSVAGLFLGTLAAVRMMIESRRR